MCPKYWTHSLWILCGFQMVFIYTGHKLFCSIRSLEPVKKKNRNVLLGYKGVRFWGAAFHVILLGLIMNKCNVAHQYSTLCTYAAVD